MHIYRTHNCAALTKQNVGETVRLSGWVHRKRDHGGVIFIDLRDHYGLTQIIFNPGSPGLPDFGDPYRILRPEPPPRLPHDTSSKYCAWSRRTSLRICSIRLRWLRMRVSPASASPEAIAARMSRCCPNTSSVSVISVR